MQSEARIAVRLHAFQLLPVCIVHLEGGVRPNGSLQPRTMWAWSKLDLPARPNVARALFLHVTRHDEGSLTSRGTTRGL
jgi:hypothetical protein